MQTLYQMEVFIFAFYMFIDVFIPNTNSDPLYCHIVNLSFVLHTCILTTFFKIYDSSD